MAEEEKERCEPTGAQASGAAEKIAEEARPGQFVMVTCRDESRLLPRPLSLCGIDPEKGELRLVYRAGGAGTKEFALLEEGDEVGILGPLGNGFPVREAKGRSVVLAGGGIGIPPLLQTAKALLKAGAEKITAVLGYQDTCFLADEFRMIHEIKSIPHRAFDQLDRDT